MTAVSLTDLAGPRKRALLIGFLMNVLISGCGASGHRLTHSIAEKGHGLDALPSQPFSLMSSSAPSYRGAGPLRIYIEGDGRAWITPTRPSSDPTPQDSPVWTLMRADPTPSVYLARPCQYHMTVGCNPTVWSADRYSRNALQSLNSALDIIKARHAAKELELVGYSGGGTLALLLAAHREDVIQVQTLAGNLSPTVWAEMVGVSAMSSAIDPLDYGEKLSALRQRHLAGGDDVIVPPLLMDEFLKRLPEADCMETAALEGVTHAGGWEQAWANWRNLPVQCGRHLR